MTYDMTKGKTSTTLIKFATPMILSGIFQQLYNMVDSMVVGKYEGVDALASVGASYPITMLFISIATGGGLGCSVVISKLFGEQNLSKMKTAIFTALVSIMCVATVTMITGMIFCNSLIRLLGTPVGIMDTSAEYLRIYTYGVLFLFLYNISTSIFNGLGDSKTPLYFLIFSSVLNIILDIIFVKNLHMSVAGVAWATFIAQGTASILACSFLLYRVHKIETYEKIKYFDKDILKNMVKVALPSIFQMSTVAIGQLMVQSLINSFGEIVIGGYAAAIKIDSFFKVTLSTMSNAVSSFSAQNHGAKKSDRIKEGFNSALLITFIYSAIVIVFTYIFGDVLIGLFDNGSAGNSVIEVGVSYLRVVVIFYFSFSLLMCSCGALRGTSQMKSFTGATFADLSIRVALAYILINTGLMGYQAVWYSIAVGWTIGGIIAFYCYKKANWAK